MRGFLRRLKAFLPVRVRAWLQAQSQKARALFCAGPYRSVLPYTMIGLERLQTLERLARDIDRLGIRGDVVECGTCNGGSGALLARVVCHSPYRRHVWLVDSFAGLPAPGPKDGRLAPAYTGPAAAAWPACARS